MQIEIKNSTLQDLKEIQNFYKEASAFQKEKFPQNVWPEFEEEMIIQEIKENKQFKIVIENETACVWAIAFSDPMIWEDRDADPSIYIHRIATHRKFRGSKFVEQIVHWAKIYAAIKGKRYIRLDTCGDNQSLIKHYVNCGFDFLGMWKLKEYEGLPLHYQQAEVCFFEIELD